jgi:GT2 family glycosyltransferase
MKKLSVVIVNYNVKYFLEQCLHSVFKAGALMPVDVYVVDNNSVDGSVELIHEKFEDVILISNKVNTGFAKANNQAMRVIKTPYVLLLNPDTLVEEDTFLKCIDFMDSHADAGGLGVYMIDGKGNFLPESKRGLPTPWVAFYKIFGLSALFPKSKKFGRYHLGYLDKNKTHTVDVLSGAFMLMRMKTLDKVGLLDEDFFMYGEDIDLSYRITKGGFKNYYFPDTKIIHYKGESTKKSSVNYVLVFYKAMVIFAQKHFSNQHAKVVSILIHAAVYLRAGLALFTRLCKQIFAPVTDAALIYSGFILIKYYWENNYKVFHYPPIYDYIFIPGYVCVWLGGIYLSGGYDKPLQLKKIIRGLLSATVFILVVYALLPEYLRFSRALILLGTAWAALATSSIRALLQTLGINIYGAERNQKKRIVIIGNVAEGQRVLDLLKQAESNFNFVGFVSADNTNPHVLGNEQQLQEILTVYKIDEVIYCAKDVKANEIINSMLQHTQPDIEFKIAPEESSFIIGSNSINDNGSLYLVQLNAIQTVTNKRNKRLLDITLCFCFVITLPLLLCLIDDFKSFLKNLYNVFIGNYTWVNFAATDIEKSNYKPGVLTPSDAIKNYQANTATLARLNMLYARDYHVYDDLNIVLKNIKKLGRTV